MKTAVYANYKPTDALSASGFMADLPHGCGMVSKWCLNNDIKNTYTPLCIRNVGVYEMKQHY
ncbi:MAG: hypothetical protein R2568_11610 [Candidatus Scalindua sp.]|jgi:hypothetical protein|nr:hypothetical protein [Candidatus Scalindua sp.]